MPDTHESTPDCTHESTFVLTSQNPHTAARSHPRTARSYCHSRTPHTRTLHTRTPTPALPHPLAQELALDVEALAACLGHLPLAELLGVEEELLDELLGADEAARSGPPVGAQAVAKAAAAEGTHTAADRQLPCSGEALQPAALPRVADGFSTSLPPAEWPVAALPSATAAAVRTAPIPTAVVPPPPPAAATPVLRPTGTTPAVGPVAAAAVGTAPAAAGTRGAAASAAPDEDELDILLSLTGVQGSHSGGGVRATTAAPAPGGLPATATAAVPRLLQPMPPMQRPAAPGPADDPDSLLVPSSQRRPAGGTGMAAAPAAAAPAAAGGARTGVPLAGRADAKSLEAWLDDL
eukprot:198848-Chlamydomonas_euryale.AAC.1